MIRGLYTAAAGMIAQQRRHDVVTNNIANLNTPGYKEHRAVSRAFPEMLIHLVNGEAKPFSRRIGSINSGVMVEEILPIFTQGDLQETGNPADAALISNLRVFEMVNGEQVEIVFDQNGRGVNAAGETVYQPQAFFTVWNQNDEVRFTRNGSFYVDADGLLRTTDGFRVLGRDGQPIELGIPLNQVKIAPNGALLDAETGEPLDGEPALLISRIEDPFSLVREGNGTFRLENPEDAQNVQPADPAEIEIAQGFVERSNVNAVQAAVELMSAMRIYEANQKIVQFYDQTLDKAVNEIGRVQ